MNTVVILCYDKNCLKRERESILNTLNKKDILYYAKNKIKTKYNLYLFFTDINKNYFKLKGLAIDKVKVCEKVTLDTLIRDKLYLQIIKGKKMTNPPKGFKKNRPRKRGHDRRCKTCNRFCYPNYFYCSVCHSRIQDPYGNYPIKINQTSNKRGFE